MLRSIPTAAFMLALAVPAFAQTAQAPQYTISTFAGTGTVGFSGDGGPAANAALNEPYGVATDSAGNIYIADTTNNRVRKVTPDGTITTIAGTGVAAFGGDGGPALKALLSRPIRLSLDIAGNVYIGDADNSRIRKLAPSGIITTLAGNGVRSYTGDGGPATSASLLAPVHALSDNAGNTYIVDQGNHAIRKVNASGIISTIAGTGTAGYSGDGGPSAQAQLSSPAMLAMNVAGDLFIADQNNNRIRKISNGVITTVAGNGTAGFVGDGGPAISARVTEPSGLAFDNLGNLYIAQGQDGRIRVLLTNGNIQTVAGNGVASYGGDGGPATSASLNDPRSLAIFSGRVYVADYLNERIRLLTPVPQPPAISSGGIVSASAFGGFSSVSPGSWIEIYGSNLASDTRSWSGSDFVGVNAPTSLDGTSVTIGGQAAFVDFISPGQINALVPSNVGSGTQAVIVKTPVGAGTPVNITVKPAQPGLLAPPSFAVNGTQYAVAFFADGTYVLPTGAINGLSSRPAKPGDTIVLYGVGFGPVIPSMPAGQLVQQSNTLAASFQMFFGGSPATAVYSGLAPNYTGLYQFNIVVPSVAGTGAVPLTFTLGGASGTQTLYIAVQN